MPVSIVTTALLIFITVSCKSKTETAGASNSLTTINKPYSPIEGNWELVSNEIYGKKINVKRKQQFKMFQEGFFCFIMYDSLGNFHYSGAGPYEVNGNAYKETFTYASDTIDIGSKDWQKWEIKEDTLIFYGFEKAEMPDGTDVTKDWGDSKFVEKRVRVKR